VERGCDQQDAVDATLTQQAGRIHRVFVGVAAFLLEQHRLVGNTEVAQEDLHRLGFGHRADFGVGATAQQDERCLAGLVQAGGVPDAVRTAGQIHETTAGGWGRNSATQDHDGIGGRQRGDRDVWISGFDMRGQSQACGGSRPDPEPCQ